MINKLSTFKHFDFLIKRVIIKKEKNKANQSTVFF